MQIFETQEERPTIREKLHRVGITNLRTVAKINWKGKTYTFIPNFEIAIDVPEEKKGIHMSRLVESITETMSEAVEEEVIQPHTSLEELELAIIKRLEKKHPHKRAEVWIKTQLILERETPASKRKSLESYDVEVGVIKEPEKVEKVLRVKVIGNTACPHAMANNQGKTHIQRAVAMLEIRTDYDEGIALEDMIEVVEGSFSSPTYTLLKTIDENAVVQRMYENPKFVEDVAREIIFKAKQRFKGKIHVKVVSHESIHKHDVIAETWYV
ncbi:GTP cyclohydrolase [Palaeococcus pacificus DY20341]|uniref:GTP cyclohydrolase MptA n=1 Tax=Palaeococcus pacificus DY20341 TaxID=1343739 RepID=A0A075LS89_9EURY|nr:GTP cyclohydrolase IV [Palaeococcus pacificus]AIF69600.1 GTP cyclohydrolase [Palaeococcus pacificus DY20341]